VKRMVRMVLARMYGLLSDAYWQERYASYRQTYDIAPSFRFNGEGIQLYGRGTIRCGAGSYIGERSTIQAVPGASVVIGTNTSISHYVMIYTQNLVASQDLAVAPEERLLDTRDVVIGSNCWIGARTFIRQGVRIGDDCVVGANSVVASDLPAHCVAGGVPARVLHYKPHGEAGA
jgi:maltose O-acetyltransferase